MWICQNCVYKFESMKITLLDFFKKTIIRTNQFRSVRSLTGMIIRTNREGMIVTSLELIKDRKTPEISPF